MKKSCLVMTAIFASVLAVNSSSLMAQTADVSAKTEEELAKENAALRKQIRRLELEVQNAKLRDRVDRLNTQIETAAAPTNAEVAAQPKANVNTQVWTGSAAKISPAAANAYAADLPVKEPPKGVAVGQYGFYAWLDGSYQRINLPNYSLGFKHTSSGIAPAGFTDGGNVDSFDAHADGAGIAGGVGYLLPYAPTSPLFGSDLRVEVAGSYVKASATQTNDNSFTAPFAPGVTPGVTLALLTGVPAGIPTNLGFVFCVSASICQKTASLHTDYASWQISGRIASDYRFGFWTLTPSLGLFGGNTHNNQAFAQTVLSTGIVPTETETYNAATSLKWTDLGGRLGLESKYAIHPWVTLGLGGWVGWVDRWTDFSGNDSASFGPGGGFGGNAFSAASSVVANATTTAFLANLEASVAVTPSPFWTARAFVGLNYDDSVPGFSTPTWSGRATAPNSVSPAAIVYAKEASWYAGGGVAYRFY